MVFFTCNACGESLKKGQVEKHTAMCRNCQCLSCIDCGKDFWGEDYKSHLKCISEDQKYGGKGFEAKANKGDVKQQQWIQRIHEVMNKPSITPNIKNILNQISTYDNIPRKKAKFQNWMKNSLKIHNSAIQDQVWEIFSEATSTKKEAAGKDAPIGTATAEETSQPSESTEETKKKSKRERKEERQKKNKKEKKDLNSEEHLDNGIKNKGKKRKMEEETQDNDEDKTDKKKKKKQKCENDDADVQENGEEKPRAQKKRKHEEPQEQEDVENSVEDNDEESSANKGKFNWKGTIKALLKQAPDNELPVKKLRKKVIAQYYTVSSAQHKSEEEILATFNKKMRSNPKFRVLKEKVKLVK